MVLELVPEQLAAAITERLHVPTIGIGAGAGCSGQVQVITDLIGLGDFIPKHARPYVRVREQIRGGGTRLCRRRRGRHLPRTRADRPDGRGGPRRGARSRRVRPARPARSRSAASRSIATSEHRRRGPLDRIVRTRADAAGCPRRRRAPGRARPDDGLAPRRPPRADARGPAPPMRRRSSRSSSTRASSTSPTDFTKYPRNEARDLAICEAEGVDLVFAPDRVEVYPPGLRHRRLGRRGRPAARGRRAARAFRRRRDGRRDPVRPGRRRPRLLRAEGRPAGHGHPPDGARPGDPDRRSSPARPSASPMAWRCRRATST